MKKLLFAILLIAGLAQAQTTTTITGTIKDLSGALITSGQVAFTLQPGIDTSMSGVARFSSSEIDCLINGSGLVKALDGTSACGLTQNTAITSPSGTSYKGCIQPLFIQPGSCFVFYAIGSTLDITTTPATPSLTPAYSLVDTFSNQTIAGNKTFSGIVGFTGTLNVGSLSLSGALTALNGGTLGGTFSGSPTLSGNPVFSGAPSFSSLLASGKVSAGGAASSASVSGDGTFARGASVGALYLGTDGFGNLLRNGDSISITGSTLTWTLPADGSIVGRTTTDTLPNKTLISPAINGQTADTINQKAATTFLLKDNTGGTRYSIPSGGSAQATLNNTAVGAGSSFTGTFVTSVGNDGSGFKHKRFGATCSTSTTQGSSCTTAETWTTAFADASYTVVCTPLTPSNTPGGIDLESVVASGFTLRVFNLGTGAAASYGGVNCTAVHD